MSKTERYEKKIAVIGMSCRFPGGGTDPLNFWNFLKKGSTAGKEFSGKHRKGWEDERFRQIRFGGILEENYPFDHDFFYMKKEEADGLEGHSRLCLELCWEALESGGLFPQRNEKRNTGVFIGISSPGTYFPKEDETLNSNFFLGNPLSTAAGRVSYHFGFRGPSMVIDTSCSSSLVAVHQACSSLLLGECDTALAGGINLLVSPEYSLALSRMGLFSGPGGCRPFEAGGSGFFRSEGGGIIFLKPYSRAVQEGNMILGIIRGSAVRHSGYTPGYSVPSREVLIELYRSTLKEARLEPGDLDFIETNAPGITMMEVPELEALGKVYGMQNEVLLGTLKPALGHLEGASGIAGVIKLLLSFMHKEFPSTRKPGELNPWISWKDYTFSFTREHDSWPGKKSPVRAAVNSFGFSGTAVHLILEEAEEAIRPADSQWHIFPLSADHEEGVSMITENLIPYFKQAAPFSLNDLSYSFQNKKRSFSYRGIFVCKDKEDGFTVLREMDKKRIIRKRTGGKKKKIIFMFSGLGDQYVNMTKGLYDSFPIFRKAIDRAHDVCLGGYGVDLKSILYPEGYKTETTGKIDLKSLINAEPGKADKETGILNDPLNTHAVVFSIEYAVTSLLLDWGITPSGMIGYSMGEYTAACIAGVLSLDDAIKLIIKRARLIDTLPKGVMLMVPLPAEEIAPLLEANSSVSLESTPARCVVSGPPEEIGNLEKKLKERELVVWRLQTTHPYHSSLLKPMSGDFLKVLGEVNFSPPRIPYISNVTGTWVERDSVLTEEYWLAHTMKTVRFAGGMEKLLKLKDHILLEIGPGQSLCNFTMQNSAFREAEEISLLSSVRNVNFKWPDEVYLLTTIGKMWLEGVDISWERINQSREPGRLCLVPTYPFRNKKTSSGVV